MTPVQRLHPHAVDTQGEPAGYVLQVDDTGLAWWQPASGGATSLDELTDVDTTTTPPTSGQVLKYEGAQWVPAADVSGGAVVTVGTELPPAAESPTPIFVVTG